MGDTLITSNKDISVISEGSCKDFDFSSVGSFQSSYLPGFSVTFLLYATT